MKKIHLTLLLCLLSYVSFGQEFNAKLAEARTAYTGGNLSNSRFAMEQMMRELDVAIGKEILKILPAQMEMLKANTKDDNVTGAGAGIGMGLFVQRTYGVPDTKAASLDIINNSPLIGTLNAMLSIPFIGGAGDLNQKVVKVHGYKGLLNKTEDTETGKSSYELQIPLQNTLVTLKVDDTKEAEMMKMASTLPLDKISSMAK